MNKVTLKSLVKYTANLSSCTDKSDLNSILSSSSSHSGLILFKTAENENTEQLLKFLKLESNPNSQMVDGNTCLHLSASNNHKKDEIILRQIDPCNSNSIHNHQEIQLLRKEIAENNQK